MIRSLRRVGGSAYTGRFRGACSTTSSEESGAGKARNRTSELEESDLTGLPAVLQRSANMLCGLSERTMTQKVLHVGLNSGGVGDKSFCYFLGDSSVFDVSGVGDYTLDVEAVKKCREIVDALMGIFLKFDFRNGALRKKYDGLKYTLKKMENTLYEMSLTSAAAKRSREDAGLDDEPPKGGDDVILSG